MSNKNKRVLLFLLGCITVRLSFVFIAKYASKSILPYLGGLALLPSIGFFTIYFTNYYVKIGEIKIEIRWQTNQTV